MHVRMCMCVCVCACVYKRVEADLVGYLIGRYKKWRAAAIHSIIDRLSIRLQLHSLKHVGKSCLGGVIVDVSRS